MWLAFDEVGPAHAYHFQDRVITSAVGFKAHDEQGKGRQFGRPDKIISVSFEFFPIGKAVEKGVEELKKGVLLMGFHAERPFGPLRCKSPMSSTLSSAQSQA